MIARDQKKKIKNAETTLIFLLLLFSQTCLVATTLPTPTRE